mgnify:FL=1
MIIKLIIIILFMFFSVFIEEVYKTKKNRNEKKIIPNFTPAELKYNYSSLVNERDLTSIIVNLAEKGYIKITPEKIIKLKKYKENISSEKFMFESLFKKGNSVMITELHKNLYKDISNIVHSIDNKQLRKEMNEKELLYLNNCLVILTFIIFLIINISLPYNFLKKLVITLMTWICFVSLVRVYTSKNSIRSKILVTFLTFILGFPFYFMTLSKIENNMIIFIIGHISTIIIINTLKSLIPKTKTGLNLKNEAEKFNNFLTNITKEEVKERLKKDPYFLEKTFPYAYAFNHTFKWKRFLKKYKKQLVWFDGTDIELTEVLVKIKNQIIKSGHKED